MIDLSIARVTVAGLAAYEAGTLTAQSSVPVCRYRNSVGANCIVGSAMSPEELNSVDRDHDANQAEVGYLLDEQIASTDDRELLSDLQQMHDAWARSVRHGEPSYALGSESEPAEFWETALVLTLLSLQPAAGG